MATTLVYHVNGQSNGFWTSQMTQNEPEMSKSNPEHHKSPQNNPKTHHKWPHAYATQGGHPGLRQKWLQPRNSKKTESNRRKNEFFVDIFHTTPFYTLQTNSPSQPPSFTFRTTKQRSNRPRNGRKRSKHVFLTPKQGPPQRRKNQFFVDFFHSRPLHTLKTSASSPPSSFTFRMPKQGSNRPRNGRERSKHAFLTPNPHKYSQNRRKSQFFVDFFHTRPFHTLQTTASSPPSSFTFRMPKQRSNRPRNGRERPKSGFLALIYIIYRDIYRSEKVSFLFIFSIPGHSIRYKQPHGLHRPHSHFGCQNNAQIGPETAEKGQKVDFWPPTRKKRRFRARQNVFFI